MVQHQIDESAWSTDESIRSTYIPAVSELVKSITGCKTALVNNVAFRRKAVDYQADPKFYHKRGGALDEMARAMPTDQPFGEPTTQHTLPTPQSPSHLTAPVLQ